MQLKLTEEQRNYVKSTFNNDRFEVRMGEKEPLIREYYSVQDILKEFEENGIESGDFDSKAHEIYNKLLGQAYNLSEALS
jgi:hypothetical protein